MFGFSIVVSVDDTILSYIVLAVAFTATVMFFLVAIYIGLRYHAKVYPEFTDSVSLQCHELHNLASVYKLCYVLIVLDIFAPSLFPRSVLAH